MDWWDVPKEQRFYHDDPYPERSPYFGTRPPIETRHVGWFWRLLARWGF